MKKFVLLCLLGLAMSSSPATAWNNTWADYTFSQPQVPHYVPYWGSAYNVIVPTTYTFVGFDDDLNSICRADWCDANGQCWQQNVYC
jgi:hypothetical protein